jgi:hypothetical protein
MRLAFLATLLALQGVPAFDETGIAAFWEVQAQLARGAEPPTADWDALFATPGYAALEARERRRAGLTDAMRLAFLPSMAAARDSAIRTNTFTGRSAKHLMGVPAARDSIERFLTTLRRSTVVSIAKNRVGEFVPRGLTDSVAPPVVALTFFLDDGRGYPTVIVADLLRLTRTGIDTGYFAHEFYHFYRRRFARERPAPAPLDAGIAELLGYPAEEGFADQLDKRRYVDPDDATFDMMASRPGFPAYARGYRESYGRAAAWMSKVSTALERGLAKPDSAGIFARAMRDSIPDQGRPLGAYMARTIDRVAGRAAMIAASRDTYDFWLAYDDVASRTSGAPRMSARALGVVRRLAER